MSKSSSYRSSRSGFANTSSHEQTPFFSTEAPVQTKEEDPFFQAKLSIGAPNDKFEKEADNVADKVVQRLATPLEDEHFATNDERMKRDRELRTKPEIQHKCSHCEQEAPATASTTLSNRIDNSRGHGSPLPANTLSEMQSSFGHDFSGVNIHTDAESVSMNRELGAQAFTHGNDIYFNTGKFNPDSSTGKHLLAHELTHVVQQNAAHTHLPIQRRVATELTYQEAQHRINAKDLAGSFQIVMNDLIATGKVNPHLFTYKFVDDPKQGEGLTISGKYKKDPKTGKYSPVHPSEMTIYPKAFSSVEWLVSSIMHEYQHVLQQQRPIDHAEIVSEGKGGRAGESGAADEVEAYLWEMEHIDETGVSSHPGSIATLFKRLTTHYNDLGQFNPAHQAMYADRYDEVSLLVTSRTKEEDDLEKCDNGKLPPDQCKKLYDKVRDRYGNKKKIRRDDAPVMDAALILAVNRVLSQLWPPARRRIIAWVEQQRKIHPGTDLSGNVGEIDYVGSLATGHATLKAPPLAKFAMTFDHIKPDKKRIFTIGQGTSITPLIEFCHDIQQSLLDIKGYDIKQQFDVVLE